MNQEPRWPLHPQPTLFESLSSWLERLARLYHLSVKELLTDIGRPNDRPMRSALDVEPPTAVLVALADRTGVDLAHLQMMTLAGWVPSMMDSLSVGPEQAQETFDTYVRQHSVLFAPGEAGRNTVGGRMHWRGVWWSGTRLERVCPVCTAGPDPRRALVWQLPLVVGCGEHRCRLHDTHELAAVALAVGETPPVPVDEPLATLDRYTYEGLATGRVGLPGRSVHVGVWFRLLRSLLDELSLAPSGRNARARSTLEQIWRATGQVPRAGLTTWRPYERMGWPLQEAMLQAAATALHLVAEHRIIAYGTLASALAATPHRYVDNGDRPTPQARAWRDATAEAQATLAIARTDHDTAQHVLAMRTLGCRTPAQFEDERAALVDLGIPDEFLLSARELRNRAFIPAVGPHHRGLPASPASMDGRVRRR